MPYNSQTTSGPKPAYGNYVCANLNCNLPSNPFASSYDQVYGNYPDNGATWCGTETASGVAIESATNGNPGLQGTNFSSPLTSALVTGGTTGSVGLTLSSISKNVSNYIGNLPGSTEVLFTCANGRITAQVDSDGRNHVCIQTKTTASNGDNFTNAYFVVNRWQDCYYQNTSQSCLNSDQRDCQWVVGASIQKDSTGQPLVWDNSTDQLVPSNGNNDPRQGASCVPLYAPGFDTSSSASAQSICGLANTVCYVNVSQGVRNSIFNPGQWDTGKGGSVFCTSSLDSSNSSTISSTWENNLNNLCTSLGDCGVSVNYVGGATPAQLSSSFTNTLGTNSSSGSSSSGS